MSGGRPADARITLAAVGDICLQGVDGDPFKAVTGPLSADVLFGNLECCFADSGAPRRKNVVFNAPASAADTLSRFDVLCLANNHTLDFGPDGLADTVTAVSERGLRFTGAGMNGAEARKPLRFEKSGVRFGVVSTADATAAPDDGPTISAMTYRDTERTIAALRDEVDVLIASYHGGIELDDAPSPSVVRGLRGFIRAGADVVLGHHPHVLQAAETYQGGLIVYSLGNFVFDCRRYGEKAGVTATTAVLRVELTLEPEGDRRRVAGVEHWFVPVRIGNDFKPVPAEGSDRAAFDGRLQTIGAALAAVDENAVDRLRLENQLSEVHKKPIGVVIRYALTHFKDYSFKELLLGGWMFLKRMIPFRSRGERRSR